MRLIQRSVKAFTIQGKEIWIATGRVEGTEISLTGQGLEPHIALEDLTRAGEFLGQSLNPTEEGEKA